MIFKTMSLDIKYKSKDKEKRWGNVGGPRQFFRISLSHDTLYNYYKTNFALMQHHKYSLTELENMMPFEREIYLGLLEQHIREENEKAEREKNR